MPGGFSFSVCYVQTEPLKHGLAKLLPKYHGGYNSQDFKWCILSNSVQHKGTYWYCLYKVLKMKIKGGGWGGGEKGSEVEGERKYQIRGLMKMCFISKF